MRITDEHKPNELYGVAEPSELPKADKNIREQPTQPERSVILKYAGFGCTGLLILSVVVGFIGFKVVQGWATDWTEQYTDSAPVEVPEVEISEEEWEVISKRYDRFLVSLADESSSSTLRLSSKDINAMISRHETFSPFKGKIHVTIKDDRIHALISMSLEMYEPFLKDRYINGTGIINLGMTESRLMLFVEEFKVDGVPLPSVFMDPFSAHNQADHANADPELPALLDKFDSITVEDGYLVLVSKKRNQSTTP